MNEPEAPACMGCGGPHKFDTSLPSIVWNEVIRPDLPDYLCLGCIVAVFATKNRSFTATLYGERLNGITIEVRIGGKVADDAHRINAENTLLRSTLGEIRGHVDEVLTKVCRPPKEGN